MQNPAWRSPELGWHWGNRGVVSSAALEKPHLSGWRPILEGEFDLAYSPLMELDYGKGRLTLCTLDLEDHYAADPAADLIGRQLVKYVASAPLAPKADNSVVYVGGDAGAALLDQLGVVYTKGTGVAPDTKLLMVGADGQANAGSGPRAMPGRRARDLPGPPGRGRPAGRDAGEGLRFPRLARIRPPGRRPAA